MAFTKIYDPGTSFLLGELSGAGWVFGTSTGPASYASSGFAAALGSDLGLSTIYYVDVQIQNQNSYRAAYNYANSKIEVYYSTAADATNIGQQVANALNLSGNVFRVGVFGIYE